MSFQDRRRTPLKRTPLRRAVKKPFELSVAGFGSKLEAAVVEKYRVLERAGEISELKLQPLVYFSCGMRWRPDAVYFCHDRNCRVWVEAKGVWGKNGRVCVNLWRDGYGPGPLELWKGDFRSPVLVETIIPKVRA